jgi:hypothetical protein
MPRVKYPAFQQYPEFRGVFVGGCIDRGDGPSFRAKAHAHTKEPHKGWICARSAKRLYVPGTDRPSKLMLHELAHILTGHGHDDTWRREVRRLGGTINHWETKAWHRQRRGIMTETTTSEDTMTPEQRKELHKKNQEYLENKRAKRKALAAGKKGRKQPVEVKTAEPAETAPERTPEAPPRVPEASEGRKRESLGALKARVKETWPAAKYMADAKHDELVALIERGDAELFKQYQETWAKRSKVRYEAWLKGDSKSAEALRTKRTAGEGEAN